MLSSHWSLAGINDEVLGTATIKDNYQSQLQDMVLDSQHLLYNIRSS